MSWQLQLSEAEIGSGAAALHRSKLDLVIEVCISIVRQADFGVNKVGVAAFECRIDLHTTGVPGETFSYARELSVDHEDPWRLGISTTRQDVAQWILSFAPAARIQSHGC